jgi:hypothetical protein
MISLCSFRATVPTPEGTPREFDREIQSSQSPVSGMAFALSGQPIGLRGHDEVVPMEAAQLTSSLVPLQRVAGPRSFTVSPVRTFAPFSSL